MLSHPDASSWRWSSSPFEILVEEYIIPVAFQAGEEGV